MNKIHKLALLLLLALVMTSSNARGQQQTRKIESANSLWSSTVDWYNPPPHAIAWAKHHVRIPHELFIAVPEDRRQKAIAWLGTTSLRALTPEQCGDLFVPTDARPILDLLISKNITALEFRRKHPIDLHEIPSIGFDSKAVKESKANDLAVRNELQAELVQYRAWRTELRPFLIKAVALNEQTGGFDGGFTSNVLVVAHTCLGTHPLPMKKVSVVAFLPRKPAAIYTSLAMAE